MMHNTLYRLQKNQYLTLVFLGILFVITSIIWFFAELSGSNFPLEPIVVLIGGLATLFAVFWPFIPTYADRRLSAKEIFDYQTNSGYFFIGREDLSFELKFSQRDDKSIHMNITRKPTYQIAVAQGVSKISEIKDVSAFDYSSQHIELNEGDIACVKNNFGKFACIKILDVKSKHNNVDDRYEVTFSYVINPDNGTDFS